MQPMVTILENQGLKVVRIQFTGHTLTAPEKEWPMPMVSKEHWLNDFEKAYDEASALAREKNLPLYYFGYSMSALVAVYSIEADNKFSFDKMVLLAPALRSSGFSRMILWFPFADIPSGSPKKIRSHNTTSKSAYETLFELQDGLKSLDRAKEIPTLLIWDKKDRMVDTSKITKWLSEENASQWTIEEAMVTSMDHHLLIDQENVRASSWNELQQSIPSFLCGNSTIPF
jgi:hypothetical protein